MYSPESVLKRLIASLGFANVSDGLLVTATPLLATTLTRSPSAIAAVTTCTRLPWLFVTIPAGVLLDRFDRRNVLSVAVVVRSVASVGLLMVAAAHTSIAALYIVALLVGTGEVLVETATPSLIPDLIPRDRLVTANSWSTTVAICGNNIVGPAVGGVLFSIAGLCPFALAALFYAIGALLVARLPSVTPSGSTRPTGEPRANAGGIRVGFRWIKTHELGIGLLLVQLTINGLQNMLIAIAVVYATQYVGLGAVGYGLMFSIGALGGILMTLIVPRLQARYRTDRILLAGFIVLVGDIVIYVVTRSAIAATLATVVNSACFVLLGVVSEAVRQAAIPATLRGRVTSIFRLVSWGGAPIFAMVSGLIASTWGIQASLGVIAGLSAAGCATVLLVPAWKGAAKLLAQSEER